MKVLYERVAGIDVHKDMIKVAIRSPGEKPWTRKTEILEFRTFYGVLQEMARELRRRGVTHVVMEASGVYTEPVYYALCEQDFTEVAVINPAHAKALKGHKTDARDCARLAELFECGLLRGSYIPPAELKEVRDLTRYRMKTVQARTSEIQRLGKALESAGIKLGSVASSITGTSSTAMIESLIDGERRGAVLAELAIGRMRSAGKLADLSMALEGRFEEHHAMLCRLHLDHLDHLDGMLKKLDAQIEAMMQPFRAARDLLITIPGIGALSAAAVISEIGADVRAYFPTAAHLASWAGLCPGNHESAGKRSSGRRRHGNKHLQPVLVEIAWAAVRHEGYLKSLYRRHVMRNGGYRSSIARNKAIITVAHAILVIIWHVPATGRDYQDLGPDYFDRRAAPARETARLIAKLEALGKRVIIEDTAA